MTLITAKEARKLSADTDKIIIEKLKLINYEIKWAAGQGQTQATGIVHESIISQIETALTNDGFCVCKEVPDDEGDYLITISWGE